MLQGFYGLLIAMVLTALLAYQASRAAPGSRLRQTYMLAAGGFGLIIAINLLWLIGVSSGLLLTVVSFAAVAMLIGAVTSFAVALFNGEFGAKIREAQTYTADERERIAQRRFERERSAGSNVDHPPPTSDAHDESAGR